MMRQGPAQAPMHSYTLDRNDARSTVFSELEAYWTIPLHETSIISDVGVTKGFCDVTCVLHFRASKITRDFNIQYIDYTSIISIHV